MNRVILIGLCLCLPVFATADAVIKSGGNVSQLMTIGYNKALDEARTYYKEEGLTYSQSLVDTTLNFLSAELTGYLRYHDYSLFMRENELTYFNLFLSKGILNVNELTFDSSFIDINPEKSTQCHYYFEWDIEDITDPEGELISKCQPIINENKIEYHTGLGDDSIYTFVDYNENNYTSETIEGIPDYLLSESSELAYIDFLDYMQRYFRSYTLTGYSTHVTRNDFIEKDYILDGQVKTLISGTTFYAYYLFKYTGIDRYSGKTLTEENKFSVGSGTIKVNLPLAPNPEDAVSQTEWIDPFTDLPVKGRFLYGLSQNTLEVSRLTDLLNSAWRSVSSRKGYSGIPYRENYRVTDSMLQNHLTQNNTTLTQLDLYDVIPSGRISLYRWSDRYGGYVASEETVEGEKIPLDVGPYPNIAFPEMVSPSVLEMLFPILNAFDFLNHLQLSERSSTCPAITVPFLDTVVSNNTYCDVIKDERELIRVFFVIVWTMSGLFVLFRSH